MPPILFYSVVLLVFAVLVTAAIAGFRAAPFVPTFQRDVIRMLELASVAGTDTVADLGAGDGRFIVTAARRFGARSFGYEISILMYVICRLRIIVARVSGRARMKFADFFHADFSSYSVICCFLTPRAMERLEAKFTAECPPGTRICSYAFKLPHMQPDAVSKPTPTSSPIFLYTTPLKPMT